MERLYCASAFKINLNETERGNVSCAPTIVLF